MASEVRLPQQCGSIKVVGVANATVLSCIQWLEQTACAVQLMEGMLCKLNQLSLIAEPNLMCSTTLG